MVDRLIEKWRGIDRWPRATAMVMSYETVVDGRYDEVPPEAKITFYYLDTTKSLQSGELIVDSLTSLYSLRANDTFEVRFDPQQPSTFYSNEASGMSKSPLFFWTLVTTLSAFVLAILFFARN